jgi:NAD+ synthase (glutamine-hydrolysing)
VPSKDGKLRLALAQIDPTVGDIEGNAAVVREWAARARDEGAGLVLFPELCIPGYPAEDLYLRPHFVAANTRAVHDLAAEIEGIAALVGFAEAGDADDGASFAVHNSLALLEGERVRAIYRKNRLPNYGVFDEHRYFTAGREPAVVELGDEPVGLTVCEDIWFPGEPATLEAARGARLIANASASPYHRGKGLFRERMVGERAREAGVPFAMCNTVGGQDELVFDGHSVVVDREGRTVARAPQFEEALLVCELDLRAGTGAGELAEPLEPVAEVYAALRLGLADYVNKNGFRHVGVALSGGIDSALVALIAVDALGPDRVTCVVMPSPHSSAETQEDARRIARGLGCGLIEIPIERAMGAYDELLAGSHGDGAVGEAPGDAALAGTAPGIAAENLQARIRGNLMMALSNEHGWLVLTTGNKSEMSVGYATLYGDMAGGFAVIKDVPKTLVYDLVRHRNGVAGRDLVPASVIDRAPSAELRPDQRDSDSLPPYEVLDRILEEYVERDRSRDEIVAAGLPQDVVDDVIHKVDLAEYKRRQAPPGIKITPKAFGRDRRLPITNRFKG